MLKRFSFVQCIFFSLLTDQLEIRAVRGLHGCWLQLTTLPPTLTAQCWDAWATLVHIWASTHLSLSPAVALPHSLSLSLSCTHSPPLSALFLPWTPTNSHCVSVLLTWLLSPLVNQHKKSCPVLFPHYTYSTYCLSLIILLSLTTANPPPPRPNCMSPTIHSSQTPYIVHSHAPQLDQSVSTAQTKCDLHRGYYNAAITNCTVPPGVP